MKATKTIWEMIVFGTVEENFSIDGEDIVDELSNELDIQGEDSDLASEIYQMILYGRELGSIEYLNRHDMEVDEMIDRTEHEKAI